VGRTLRFLFILIWVVGVGVSSGRAQAANAKAEALVNQAVELRRSGDDQGALALLQQAYAMGRAPRTAGQLGLCEQALGRWADAEVFISEALKAESDPWVKKSRRVLEDALVVVKSHIARIEIEGEPEGAEIWVNGVLVGKLPFAAPVRVSAGEIEVELRSPGFVRESKTLRLEAGQYQRIVLRASKQTVAPPPAPAVAPAPPPAAPSTTTVVVKLEERDRPQPSPQAPAPAATSGPSSGRSALKWVAWGLGAAALGVGTYGVTQNSSLVSAFNSAGCGVDRMGRAVDRLGIPSKTCESKRSDYQTMAHVGIGGFVAGGVLVATGLVLWLTEPTATASKDTAGLSCAPSLTEHLGPAVGCALRF
jgi:PEGA domain